MNDSQPSTRESFIDREEFFVKLRTLGVPAELIEQAWAIVKGSTIGLLVYGSWARNEARESSDLDMLLLSNVRTRPHPTENVSISFYSSDQLIGARRTLFGTHLARDGMILHDTDGQMKRILATFTPPDPGALLRRVRDFSAILDVTSRDRVTYLSGLTQVARYLLRTAMYALALQDGRPCFSLDELSIRFDQPELRTLLSSHPGVYPEPSDEVLADLVHRLATAVGPGPENPYGSLHALIVVAWQEDRDLANLATLTLGVNDSLPYSEIPKVVL